MRIISPPLHRPSLVILFSPVFEILLALSKSIPNSNSAAQVGPTSEPDVSLPNKSTAYFPRVTEGVATVVYDLRKPLKDLIKGRSKPMIIKRTLPWKAFEAYGETKLGLQFFFSGGKGGIENIFFHVRKASLVGAPPESFFLKKTHLSSHFSIL